MKKINFKNLKNKVNTKKIEKIVGDIIEISFYGYLTFYIVNNHPEVVIATSLILGLSMVIYIWFDLITKMIAEFIGTITLIIKDSLKNY